MTHPESLKKILADWGKGESPFHIKHMSKLLMRPDEFFSSELSLEKPRNFLLAVWIYGLASYAQQGSWGPTEGFYNSLIKSFPVEDNWWMNLFGIKWVFYSIVTGFYGLVMGAIGYFIGGLIFDLRLSWSGEKNADEAKIRTLYLYVSFVWTAPVLLMGILGTLIYSITGETYMWGYWVLIMVDIFFYSWSIWVGYHTVTSLFEVKKNRALFWFVILPGLYPLSSLLKLFIV
jgi:hypothetical protein